MEDSLNRSRERLVQMAGGLVVLLGCVVMVGWITGSTSLLQVLPAFAPMQFNTALGFVIVGLYVVALARHMTQVGRVLAALTVLLGMLSGLQYLLGVDLLIDQLIMEHYVTVGTSQPGRMAPNTALCFVLSGSAGLLLAGNETSQMRCLAAEILGSVTAGLAFVSLLGYATGVEDAYGWGRMTSMAVHTAAGFSVLGTAILAGAWITDERNNARSSHLLVLPVGIAIMVVLVSLAAALTENEQRRVRLATATQIEFLDTVIVHHIGERIRALQRMAGRLEANPRTTQSEWEADAQRYIEDFADFRFVARATADAQLSWLVASNSVATSPLPATLPDAIALAAQHREPAVMPGGDTGLADMLVVVPLTLAGSKKEYLVANLDTQSMLLSPVLNTKGYDFLVTANDNAILRSVQAPQPDTFLQISIRPFHHAIWSFQVRPTEPQLAELRSPLTRVVLSSSTIGSVLLLIVIHFAQMAARRAEAVGDLNRQLQDAQRNLAMLAHFDTLTSLGNRNLFLIKLDELLEIASAGNFRAGVMLLDLNGFKAVNDELGHKAGDLVLQEVATRLPTLLRQDDEMFRIGGDEFAILLRPGTSEKGALAMAQKMQDLMLVPIMLYNTPKSIGLSIGLAMYPQHGRSKEVLVRQADVAMYKAKSTGKPAVASSDLRATQALQALQGNKKPDNDKDRRSARR